MQDCASRPTSVVTINRDDTIQKAAALMLSYNVGCLIVNDEEGDFVGVVSERDVARRVARGCDTTRTSVASIMTDRVISCAPGTPTHEARRLMTAHRIRHLPIVEDGVVAGILSVRDVMAQQLLEDRAAAEEVAVLSKCLKSIDLQEAVEIVATQAPKLFEATSCALCLYPDGDVAKGPEFVSSNRCLCFDGSAKSPDLMGELLMQGGPSDKVPAQCASQGGRPPRLVLPLDIVSLPHAFGGKERRLTGFVCMCGLNAACMANEELTAYKAGLAKEILVAHLTNALRYQQARLTSLTDALTGVGSRKLLEEKLQEEYDRARRYKRPFAVAIFDLDHFKMINDTLGHAAGDDAIRQLAHCMNERKRKPDALARYGGDEFVMLMPETRASDAAALLERIRAKVPEIQIGEDMSLTVSCGVAECMLDQDSAPGDVMRRADLALYEAKSAGRNCVKLWDKNMGRLFSAGELEIERIKRLQRRILGLSEMAEKMFMESIRGLVQALEAKDIVARKHSEKVMHYAAAITRTMDLGPKHVELIQRAAMIHDIGKIGVPDAILFKPEALTPRERRIIEQHPLIAQRILEPMTFLEREVAIVRHHHEKWNGQGYPDGLARTAIPLGARVIAVADAFDALTSIRTYHAPRAISEAMRILKDSADYDLDPSAVEAMLSWIGGIGKQLGKAPEELTVEDLLVVQGENAATSVPCPATTAAQA